MWRCGCVRTVMPPDTGGVTQIKCGQEGALGIQRRLCQCGPCALWHCACSCTARLCNVPHFLQLDKVFFGACLLTQPFDWLVKYSGALLTSPPALTTRATAGRHRIHGHPLAPPGDRCALPRHTHTVGAAGRGLEGGVWGWEGCASTSCHHVGCAHLCTALQLPCVCEREGGHRMSRWRPCAPCV